MMFSRLIHYPIQHFIFETDILSKQDNWFHCGYAVILYGLEWINCLSRLNMKINMFHDGNKMKIVPGVRFNNTVVKKIFTTILEKHGMIQKLAIC